MAVISGKQKTFSAFKYYAFSHSWRFGYDIAGYDYISEIRDSQENLIAEFNITKGANDITINLSEATINAMPLGTYSYDVKQISKSSRFPKRIIFGEIVIANGKTQRV